MTDVRTNGVRSSATEFDAKIDAVAFDQWLRRERAAAWAEGYLLATGGMMHDPNPYEAADNDSFHTHH